VGTGAVPLPDDLDLVAHAPPGARWRGAPALRRGGRSARGDSRGGSTAMSDFLSAGWSVYIAVVTVLGLVACLALLFIAARRRVMAGDNTTGHVWDEDLREMNNPLPRWWMWL